MMGEVGGVGWGMEGRGHLFSTAHLNVQHLRCVLLTLNRSSQNHLARHSERGKKTRQTEKVVGRQHQEMDRPGVRQAPDGNEEQRKMKKTGCKIIFVASTTLAVKG